MQVQSYRNLEVWQRARKLVTEIYRLTEAFPTSERFGLIAQMRRAAVSIPSNIAEGWGRHYPAEFTQFLRTANGSRVELETQLILSTDLGFSTETDLTPLLEQTTILGKQLLSLERRLKGRMENGER